MRCRVHVSVILSRAPRAAHDIARVPRSILGWFILAWSAFLIVALAVGGLLVSLYDQTTAEQIRRGEAAVQNGCQAIAGRVSFLLAGTTTPPASGSAALDRGLHAAVVLALRGEQGVQGGVWSLGRGGLAEAYPTAARVGARTGLVGRRAGDACARSPSPRSSTAPPPPSGWMPGSRVVLAAACPLRVAVPHLAGWTLVRVETAGGSAFLQAAGGLGILLAVLLASAAWLGLKLRFWGARLRRLEAALAQGETLPALAPTGQRDLDRIVAALNARRRAAGGGAGAGRRAGAGGGALGADGSTRPHRRRRRARGAQPDRGDAAQGRERARTGGRPVAAGAGAARHPRADRPARRAGRRPARLRVAGGAAAAPASGFAPLPGRAGSTRCASRQRRASVALSLEAPERLAATFDPDRIGRAIDNLVLNAVQNTPAGGRVLVAARRMAGALQISVSDTGNGVPPALRPHLFEPFVTGRPDGTGLGLAIVRETVEAHGGRVRALHPEEGTTITIELPE